jgi:hypothetical protein
MSFFVFHFWSKIAPKVYFFLGLFFWCQASSRQRPDTQEEPNGCTKSLKFDFRETQVKKNRNPKSIHWMHEKPQKWFPTRALSEPSSESRRSGRGPRRTQKQTTRAHGAKLDREAGGGTRILGPMDIIYVILCYVMLWYIMMCYILLCYILLFHMIIYYVI